MAEGAGGGATVPVTVDTFVRAETDRYFRDTVDRAGLGQLGHTREPTPVDRQGVIRMNRDTLYSSGVFDLDAGPVTVRLPDAGGRFLSLLPISEDHYTTGCVYGPGPHVFDAASVGTRYLALVVRIFVDPDDPGDLDAVHALQDAITIEQPDRGSFEVPPWDPATLTIVRDTLLRVAPAVLHVTGGSFGTRDEINPIRHLVGTAGGWGGNPERDAKYVAVFPERNDGRTGYRLTLRDVPVDGFWSISVYNAEGYFATNAQGRYAVNTVTAIPDDDGSVTVTFGGDDPHAPNLLPVVDGWNYVVRLYRPRQEVLDGTWTFPAAEPIG